MYTGQRLHEADMVIFEEQPSFQDFSLIDLLAWGPKLCVGLLRLFTGEIQGV